VRLTTSVDGLPAQLVGKLFVIEQQDVVQDKHWIVTGHVTLPQGHSVHQSRIERKPTDVEPTA
jgi:hypothetical protein